MRLVGSVNGEVILGAGVGFDDDVVVGLVVVVVDVTVGIEFGFWGVSFVSDGSDVGSGVGFGNGVIVGDESI